MRLEGWEEGALEASGDAAVQAVEVVCLWDEVEVIEEVPGVEVTEDRQGDVVVRSVRAVHPRRGALEGRLAGPGWVEAQVDPRGPDSKMDSLPTDLDRSEC